MNVLGKALAGVGAAVQPVALEGLRASILAKRDAVLAGYQRSMQTDVVQPFQREMQGSQQTFQSGERQATEQFQSGESEKNRQFTKEQTAPKLQGEALDNQIKRITINNAQDVQKLKQQYQAETDPAKRATISENIQILTGKDSDKFLPVPLKDEMGNITGYQIFDTKRGTFAEQGGPSGNDPLGLRGGKKDYSKLWNGAGAPPSGQGGGTPAGQQTQDQSNFTAGFNKVRGKPESDTNNNASMQMSALAGPGATSISPGALELHTAQNILDNMKASNNFTAKSAYGDRPMDKTAVIVELQKALPYAKGPQLAEIQQAIATLSSAEQQAQKDFTTGFNSVSGTPPGRK